MVIDTTEYVRVRGKRPAGEGVWYFTWNGRGGSYEGNFSRACKMAIRHYGTWAADTKWCSRLGYDPNAPIDVVP